MFLNFEHFFQYNFGLNFFFFFMQLLLKILGRMANSVDPDHTTTLGAV